MFQSTQGRSKLAIQLEPHAEGVVLPVRAAPGSKRSEVRGEQDGALKVAVTQIAEKGKANTAIVAQLAKSLKLRKSQITLLAGPTNANKRFLVRDISVDELHAKIASL